jgi:hypothetical protein
MIAAMVVYEQSTMVKQKPEDLPSKYKALSSNPGTTKKKKKKKPEEAALGQEDSG